MAALGGESAILVVNKEAEKEQLEALERWRAERDDDTVSRALDDLRSVATTSRVKSSR